jgi:hypothetical protein
MQRDPKRALFWYLHVKSDSLQFRPRRSFPHLLPLHPSNLPLRPCRASPPNTTVLLKKTTVTPQRIVRIIGSATLIGATGKMGLRGVGVSVGSVRWSSVCLARAQHGLSASLTSTRTTCRYQRQITLYLQAYVGTGR